MDTSEENALLEEISMLRHYVGSEMLMSDFQTAGQMREEITRLRSRVEELELIIRDQWIATLGSYVLNPPPTKRKKRK